MQEQIKNINSLEELQALYASVFGKNGTMTARLKEMKNLDNDARAALNTENTTLRELFKVRQAELEQAALMKTLEKNYIDTTLPSEIRQQGRLHPLTQSLEEITEVFSSMGYILRSGPEIEDDWHNFTALNTPDHHPARDMQDTFFLRNGNVMRTQTSAIQIHLFEELKKFIEKKAKFLDSDFSESNSIYLQRLIQQLKKNINTIKVFGIGATYRKEMDATHSPMFHQIEGVCISTDTSSNMAEMISEIILFLERFFCLDNVPYRIRPSYFPFTDPSVEIDIKWDKATGRIGEGNDWLEIMGAGMIHPNVLKNCGINPKEYQGYAFGFGWDRLAMLKYGLKDIRKFYDGDINWIKECGFDGYIFK